MLIPCLLREYSVEDGMSCLQSMLDGGWFTSGQLSGLGMCGNEMGKPPAMWKGIYDLARNNGIRLTAHAGEEGPAECVRDAVEILGVERVDHGVRSAEDEGVMGLLKERGLMVTMCPVSNVQLRVFKEVGETPVRKFLKEGVKFSLNSDDPAYFGGYLQEVWCAMEEAFGLSVEEWEEIAKTAVEGSWCEEKRKRELLGEVEGVLSGWRERA